MKKKYLAILFFCILMFSIPGYAAEGSKEGSNYYTLLKQLKKGDTTVDFAALRLSYTKTAEYSPYRDVNEKKEMIEALNKREFEKALGFAHSVLEKNYLDMDAHFVSRTAYKETNNTEKQNYHSFVLKGLLDSIYHSGNGQTPETAFTVITTAEEYFFLRVYGYTVAKSSLMQLNGHHYDKMDTEERKTGARAVFYFNVDMPYTWLTQQMDKKKE